jgi:hypothetical protein
VLKIQFGEPPSENMNVTFTRVVLSRCVFSTARGAVFKVGNRLTPLSRHRFRRVLITGQIPSYVFVDLPFGVEVQGPEFASFHKNLFLGGNLKFIVPSGGERIWAMQTVEG